MPKDDNATKTDDGLANVAAPSNTSFQPGNSSPMIQSDTQGQNTSDPLTEIPKPTNDETISVQNPHAPTKYGGKKVIATIFGMFLLIGGVVAGVLLVQQQQELAEKASSGSECQQNSDCILLENPEKSGTFSAPRAISQVKISAKETFTYSKGSNGDNCYKVTIENRSLSWQKIGDGPECKDISNIQVWMEKTQSEGIEWLIEQLCEGIKVKVNKEHGVFDVVIEVSQNGESWQSFQSFKGDSGSAKEYFFEYNNTLPSNSKVRAKILYNGEQVAIVTREDLSCSNPPEEPPACKYCFEKTCQTRTIQCSNELNQCETSNDCVEPTVPPDEKTTAKCNDVKTYDFEWNLLTSDDLSNLKPGERVRFAVSGTASAGTFDKARFTVNGTLRSEVTTKKPGSQEFYDDYTIPQGVTNFTVKGEVHHSELGWL